jgi:hypothetical protein
MALGATKACVFGSTLSEYFIGTAMTNGTCLIRSILRIDNLKGFVGGMARQTRGLGHLSGMGLMAFEAFRNVPMPRMVT